MVALHSSTTLDNVLQEIFNHKDTVCVGFSFKNDLEVFGRYLPRMNFFKNFTNFIDLQSYYSKVCVAPQVGLAKVTEKILKQSICKGEQMSDWEKRPLRLSQQHYAALDAYCLIPILHEIAKIGADKNEVSSEEHIRQHTYPLKYNDPKKGGFSWNEESKDEHQGNQSAFDNKKYKKNKKRTEQRRANKHNQRQLQQQQNQTAGGYNGGNGYQQHYGSSSQNNNSYFPQSQGSGGYYQNQGSQSQSYYGQQQSYY